MNSDARAASFLYPAGLEDVTPETPEPDPTMEYIIQDHDILGVALPDKKAKKDELQGNLYIIILDCWQ